MVTLGVTMSVGVTCFAVLASIMLNRASRRATCDRLRQLAGIFDLRTHSARSMLRDTQFAARPRFGPGSLQQSLLRKRRGKLRGCEAGPHAAIAL